MTFAIGGKDLPNYGLFGIQKANNLIKQSIERLSSANNIPSASFDPVGLAVSQQFQGQIKGFYRASNNIQDGISLLRTAEGGLSQIQDNTQKLRELAIQAGNGTYSDAERKALEEEARQVIGTINDIAKNTEFNNRKLLNGNTAGQVSSASPAIEGFIHGDIGRGGVYQGEVKAQVNAKGERALVLTLSNRNNGTTTTVLDQNNRAHNALNNIDLQLGDIKSAEITGQAMNFEKTISFAKDAEATFTDAEGNTGTVKIAAGSYTQDQLASQFNQAFTDNNVKLEAKFNDDGNISINGIEGNTGFVVSDTNNAMTETMGLEDEAVAISEDGEAYTGSTNKSAVSEGLAFDEAVSFRVQGSGVVAANITFGEAGKAMNKEQILEEINKGLKNLDVQATFEDNKLTFTSNTVGRDSRITVTDSNNSSALGLGNQSANGQGNSRFAITVSPSTLTFQTGANPGQNTNFSFGNFSSRSLNIDDVDFSSSAGVSDFLKRVSDANGQLSSARSQIGARENSLVSQFNNVGTSTINASSSESRIRDVDLARELIKMNTQQALLQTSLYAQTQTLNLSNNVLAGLM